MIWFEWFSWMSRLKDSVESFSWKTQFERFSWKIQFERFSWMSQFEWFSLDDSVLTPILAICNLKSYCNLEPSRIDIPPVWASNFDNFKQRSLLWFQFASPLAISPFTRLRSSRNHPEVQLERLSTTNFRPEAFEATDLKFSTISFQLEAFDLKLLIRTFRPATYQKLSTRSFRP